MPSHTYEAAWIDDVYDGQLPDVVRVVYPVRDAWRRFEVDPANTVTWDNTKPDADRLRENGASIADPFTDGVPDDLGVADPDSG